MAPTLRNPSLPFVELPGNGLGDFTSEGGASASLLESTAPTEVPAPSEDAVLVVVDAYPDQPHGVVAHNPPPDRHPVRRLVFAIRRAALAVLFAPVLVVAWFLLRIWWVARLSVTRSWHGVTFAALAILDAIGLVIDFVLDTIAAIGRGIVAAITGTLGAIARLITAMWTSIVHGVLAVRTAIVNAVIAVINAVIAVVTGIRDAILHAVALVRAGFATGVRGVFGAAAFVVRTTQRAIQSTVSFVSGVCHAIVRLALGAVHAMTSSVAAAARWGWRVVTGIRDAVVATAGAGVARVTRASRIAAAPVVVAARGLWFVIGGSFLLAWRGVLLVLGGIAIVIGTLCGLVLVTIYAVRILATTSIALARAVGPASTRVGHAAGAGAAAISRGVARGVVAFGLAARSTARLGGAAVVRFLQREGTQIAHAAAFLRRAVHAVWTGTRATAAYSAREALEHVAGLSQVAWESASRVKARVYHESPVVRVNFAALPGRAGDVRMATTLALVSTAALVLMAGGVALLLTSQRSRPAAPPVAAASLLQSAAIPVEPAVAVRRQPEPAPRPPAPAAVVPPPAAPRAVEPPAAIKPKPGGGSRLSAARLRAIWDRADTRSLDRAIGEMRSATLAFRRCEMRMTSSDEATATCNESASPRVAWTFDFRRNDDRWLIEGVSATGTPPVAP
jgi:hypothetical protein